MNDATHPAAARPLTLHINDIAGRTTYFPGPVASEAAALAACNAKCAALGIAARPLIVGETERGFVCEYVVEMAVAS